jgi:outer membrane lipoprotein SlyB
MKSALHLKSLVLALALLTTVTVAGCSDEETPTTPATRNVEQVTWSTSLASGGATSRSFKTTRNGTVSITLQSVGGSTTGLRVGLGVGIPLGDGTGCVLSRSTEAVAGATAQLELSVDAGNYCVQVYDLGTLTQPVGFTLLLVYPIKETTT